MQIVIKRRIYYDCQNGNKIISESAAIVGIMYLVGFVVGFGGTNMIQSTLDAPDCLASISANNMTWAIAAVLWLIAVVGDGAHGVLMFPILKKQNESAASGLVGIRVLEAGTIFAGVAFLLTVVTLRQNGTGAEALVTSQALVALYDRIFVVGQGFPPAFNDILLGFLLYKSRLVPRVISVIGLVGAPLLIFGFQ